MLAKLCIEIIVLDFFKCYTELIFDDLGPVESRIYYFTKRSGPPLFLRISLGLHSQIDNQSGSESTGKHKQSRVHVLRQYNVMFYTISVCIFSQATRRPHGVTRPLQPLTSCRKGSFCTSRLNLACSQAVMLRCGGITVGTPLCGNALARMQLCVCVCVCVCVCARARACACACACVPAS